MRRSRKSIIAKRPGRFIDRYAYTRRRWAWPEDVAAQWVSTTGPRPRRSDRPRHSVTMPFHHRSGEPRDGDCDRAGWRTHR